MIRNRAGLLSSAVLTVGASAVWFGSLGGRLELRVNEITGGDWWRVATCHLSHFSATQLLWDGVALLVLGMVYDRVTRDDHRRLAFAIVGSALAIPLAIAALQPGLEAYRGLSGIDSALFVLVGCLAMRECERTRERVVIGLALTGFIAKVVFEIATGNAIFVQDLGPGVIAVPLAHAAGAVIGLLAAMRWNANERACLEPLSDINGGRI